MHIERKETIHEEVGEEDIHHHIYIYIYIKDKYNVCKNGHKTGVQEEGGENSPSQDETQLPPTKACISPPNM